MQIFGNSCAYVSHKAAIHIFCFIIDSPEALPPGEFLLFAPFMFKWYNNGLPPDHDCKGVGEWMEGMDDYLRLYNTECRTSLLLTCMMEDSIFSTKL